MIKWGQGRPPLSPKPMKNKHNKVTCLFGYHDYSKKLTEDKHGRLVHLCKHCKRAAYRDTEGGFRRWYKYEKDGTCVYIRFNNGDELFLDDDGFWGGKKLRSPR